MENTKLFLKNNWFKISIIAVVIILLFLVSLVSFYLCNVYKSSLVRGDAGYYQQHSEKCAELSLLYVDNLRQQEKDRNKQLELDLTPSIEYQNHFNKKLNTCLVYADTTYQNLSNTQAINSIQEVRDLITNKIMIWNNDVYFYNSDSTINKSKSTNVGMTDDEFYKQKQQLMNE